MSNYSWDLTKLYVDEEAFLQELDKLKNELLPEFLPLQGQLKEDEKLKRYLELSRELNARLSKLSMFASQRADLNRKDVKNAEDESKVELFFHELNEKLSWEEPELLSLGEEHISRFLNENPEFKDFDYYFIKLFRDRDHILSPEKEALLSNYQALSGEAANLYSTLAVGDYRGSEVTLKNGETINVNVANWSKLIADSKDPDDRKAIFEGLYKYFDAHKVTFAEIYNLGLQSQLALKKSRGYASILDTHLYGNNIPSSVYHNLIDAAHRGSKFLKKYYEIRRKALGLEKHRSYDRFLPLATSDKKYSYEEAKELFFASIKHLPEDFQKKAHEVTKEGYVDVYPQEGKRSGAYSSGGENVHPYILLNFVGNLDDVFTLAHEAGHSIHTLYTMENQPLMKQNYTIFVAEIASTFNEHNLLDYLLNSSSLSKNEEILLLQKEIDEIASTFFRQTLFAEYELLMSEKVERGEPISYEVASETMRKLYDDYYGIDIQEEVYKPLVWAYIPHLFYTPFYVYQYATSFTASQLLYKRVREHEEGAFEKYISLLKSGGSDFPLNEVKAAGVDFTDPHSFDAVIERMDELVTRLTNILNIK